MSHTIRYRFDDGDELESAATLRFRTEDELRTSLAAAGFTVDAIFGGWQREPVGRATASSSSPRRERAVESPADAIEGSDRPAQRWTERADELT